MLLSELLDDHRDALKAREGGIVDLHRRMEELSAAGKAATEEISRLKVDLNHEVVAYSSQKEEVMQLRGKLEKGSEILKMDSELQYKESALLVTQ